MPVCSPAPVNALGNLVLRFDVAAKVSAVDFLFGRFGKRRLGLFGLDCFAQFMRENECHLVLAIQIAGELQSAMALRAVGEDRNSERIVADRELTNREDGPDRN